MSKLMKTIAILVFFALVGAEVNAQTDTKVVVITLGSDHTPAPECFVVGANSTCIDSDTVRIPVHDELDCTQGTDVKQTAIDSFSANQYTALSDREYSATPLLKTGDIRTEFSTFTGRTKLEVLIATDDLGATATLLQYKSDLKCTEPPLDFYNQDWQLYGNNWKLIPIFSSTPTSIALEELILARQSPQPLGPFVASAGSNEKVFVSVNLANGTFFARVGSAPTGSESLSFEYGGPGATNFMSIGSAWDSASNTGIIAGNYPPGTTTTSILVKGSDEYDLSAKIGESGSGEITVDELFIIKK